MPRGPLINHKVRFLIAQTYAKYRNWKAREIRDYVISSLPRTEHKPSLSAVQKLLAEYRKREEELANDVQDRPWSVTAMAIYDIPPEALPIILKLWLKHPESTEYMTIRHARWIGRLYYVFKSREKDYPEGAEDSLYFLASLYVHYEKIIEVVQYPSTPDDLAALWVLDAVLIGDKELAAKLHKRLGYLASFELLQKKRVDRKRWPITPLSIPSRKRRKVKANVNRR